MTHNFSAENTIINKFVAQLRDREVQKDMMRFRFNLERIAELMAYEVSKTFRYRNSKVETSLGISEVPQPIDRIVVSSILRAGNPMHHGLLRVFDDAESAFISSYRKHHKDGTFEVDLQYVTSPDLEGTTLILADPMVATGSSVKSAYKSLLEYGKPDAVHLLTVIAARNGIESINRIYPEMKIWAAAIDEELTAKSYIVPGLGDAGDLCFGEKMQS